MGQECKGTFENTSWDENPVEGLDGTVKVTRATIGQRWSGSIDADISWDTVMTYREDGTADFVGYERVRGTAEGRSGSFVLQTIGTFDGKEVRATASVVPGSGTGELAGAEGTGEIVAPVGSSGTYELDLRLG